MHKKTLMKPDGRFLHLFSRIQIPEGIVATAPRNAGPVPKPHQRWHPLRREWVIYAPHRQDRTFLPPKNYSPLAESKDPDFPTELPAGDYEVAVFENLFPSLNLTTREAPTLRVPTRPSSGVCEVVVFTKDPETALGNLPPERIDLILQVLADRTTELGKVPEIQYVLPFENRGVEMGVTLSHPHGQIYAYSFVPPVQKRFLRSMRDYLSEHSHGLMEAIIFDEMEDGRRIIVQNEFALAFIPAFARYPYETWVVPKKRRGLLSTLSSEELLGLAQVLKVLLQKFDLLWAKPFPYLMTLNQAPVKGEHPYAHLFFQITPPYRSRDRLKYLAGTELGAGIFVNDSLPEEKARELQDVEVPRES